MANTTEKKDPMVHYVVKEFERYENFWRDQFDEFNDIYDLWSNKPAKREFDWQNQVCVPVMVEAEQTISSRLYTALFPNEAPVDVKAVADTPLPAATCIKEGIKHFFHVSDVQGEAIPMVSQTTLYGTGYTESGLWHIKKGWIDAGDGTRYEGVIESRPACKFVSVFELFPHPAKLEVGDGLPIIRQQWADAEWVKRLADDPNFETENLKKALKSKSFKGLDPKRKDQYEVLTYWGPWDESYKDENGEVKTRKGVPYWIIVINRQVKVRGIPNPYNHQREPYTRTIMIPKAKPCWFGWGIGQMGRPTAHRLNKIVNQRLDNVDLVINKERVVNVHDTKINRRKLRVSRPGNLHDVSDINNSIKWIDVPDVTSSSYQEEKLAKDDFREATGATSHLMPTDQPQHRTAMGINLLQGAAGMRFRPVLRKMEKDFVQEVAKFYLANLQQFLDRPYVLNVMTEEGQQVLMQLTPQSIQAQVEFIPTGVGETVNKEIEVEQLLKFKQYTQDDPTVNRKEINKRIAELMGFKDVDKLLIVEQPVEMRPGGLSPEEQMMINQRLQEGATPEQIQMEMLGQMPGPEMMPAQAQGGMM